MSETSSKRRQGFTLLEVMISMAILLLFALGAMQLVRQQAEVAAIYTGSRKTGEEVESFFQLLDHTLSRIHQQPAGAFLGTATALEGAPSDTLEFLLNSGPLLGFDNGFELRALRLRVEAEGESLALVRESWVPGQLGGPDQVREVLSQVITGFDVRYYDPRVNSWVENWVDRSRPPALVRVEVRAGETGERWVRTFQLPRMAYGREGEG